MRGRRQPWPTCHTSTLALTSAGTVSDRNTSMSPKLAQASATTIRATRSIQRRRSTSSLAASRSRACIHSGAADLDPPKHRPLMWRPLVFKDEELKAMPSISRVVFIECPGNGWENWKRADEESHRAEHARSRQQQTHGPVFPSRSWSISSARTPIPLGCSPRGGRRLGVARRSIPAHRLNPGRRSWHMRRTASCRGPNTDFRCGLLCRAIVSTSSRFFYDGAGGHGTDTLGSMRTHNTGASLAETHDDLSAI